APHTARNASAPYMTYPNASIILVTFIFSRSIESDEPEIVPGPAAGNRIRRMTHSNGQVHYFFIVPWPYTDLQGAIQQSSAREHSRSIHLGTEPFSSVPMPS